MKKRLSLTLALLAMVGLAQPSQAAVWDINFGKVSASGNYVGKGLASTGTSLDAWYPNNSTTGSPAFSSTDATGALDGNYTFTASGINGTAGSKLAPYVSGLSSVSMNLADGSQRYLVYLYTTTPSTVSLSGTGGTTLTLLDGALSYSDGTTSYTVKKYSALTTSDGYLQMISVGAGRTNALQVEAIPEPGTMTLLGVGALMASLGMKRKNDAVVS